MIKDRKSVKKIIESELIKKNEYEVIDGRACFKTSSGGYIRLDTIGDNFNCVVIEFAETRKEAENNRFEDGDLLGVDTFSDDDMLKMVEQQIGEN